MPATRHDAWVWIAGGDRTAVFDNARAVLASLAGTARVAGEVTGWSYRHDRDGVRDGLTGFLTPLTGACHTCPAVEALARFAPVEE